MDIKKPSCCSIKTKIGGLVYQAKKELQYYCFKLDSLFITLKIFSLNIISVDYLWRGMYGNYKFIYDSEK